MRYIAAEQSSWRRGDPEHFTGEVWLNEISQLVEADDVRVLAVHFGSEARTNWHSHPEGQVLHVLFGRGLVVNRDGDSHAFSAGDTIVIPPGEEHWHGAAAASPMIHLSITTGGGAVWKIDK